MYRKRGQVTVFIIVGIILLASVVFLMTIVSTAKTSALETELEDTTSNLFGRESMRVFIEDCLVDSLEEGLVKIGSQGRLWNGDPGGSVTYSEYENGKDSHPGELPIVKVEDHVTVSGKYGQNFKPVFVISGWTARPCTWP